MQPYSHRSPNDYDAQNTLIETDVTDYTMTTSNEVSLSGATAQNQAGTLKVTAQ